MKVVFKENFLSVYANDPAAESGRLEAIIDTISPHVEYISCDYVEETCIQAVHSRRHIESVKSEGVYDIAAFAAGGAIKAAEIGITEPCFGLIRPPGHHASMDGYWGFCYFNNIAIAIKYLMKVHQIRDVFLLDFDLHYGDGTVNIFSGSPHVKIINPSGRDRNDYLNQIKLYLKDLKVDILCASAGFDNHELDWGGLLKTEDYNLIGYMLYEKAQELNAGLFALLEGGYNHRVLGQNVYAFLKGINGIRD